MADTPKNPDSGKAQDESAAAPDVSSVQSDEKIFAIVGYIAFLFVISLAAKPKSKFCQFHAKQSMVMFLIFIAILVVLLALPWLGSILTLIMFALYILAIYRSYRGELWSIPVIGGLASKIDLSALYGKAGLSAKTLDDLRQKAANLGEKVAQGAKNIAEKSQSSEQNQGKEAPPPEPHQAPPKKQ